MTGVDDIDSIEHAIARDDEAKEAGRREERARIVKWLRDVYEVSGGDDPCCFDLAEALMRGEHLR